MSIADERNIPEITSFTTKLTTNNWGISDLNILKNGENVTFTGSYKGQPIYTRVTENSRRSESQLLSELNWVQSIHDSGIIVANPITDLNNNYINTFKTQKDEYHVSVFNSAPGESPDKSSHKVLFIAQQLGQTIGKLHHHSKPSKSISSGRHKWSENIHVLEAEKILGDFHQPFKEEWIKCFNWWENLTKTNELLLMHMDAHTGNFNVDKAGQICLFDFDDCAWNFLPYDLAVAINGLTWLSEDKSIYGDIQTTFLESYKSEYNLDSIWIERIASFKRLRSIEMLAWSIRMYGVKDPKEAIESFNTELEVAADLI